MLHLHRYAASDLRDAVRALRSAPAFTLVAILSLALGIGANTAIFSLTNALIYKSLPVIHPEQLLRASVATANSPFLSNPLWEALRDGTHEFATTAAYASAWFNLAPDGGTERRVDGAWVSGDFFHMLGVPAVRGRLFSPLDDRRGCAALAVVNASFAERELGGATAAVGKPLSLNGKTFTVAGVSSDVFRGIDVGHDASIFVPICAQAIVAGPAILDLRGVSYLTVLVRPKAGSTMAAVSSRLATLSPALMRATTPTGWSAGRQAAYAKQVVSVEPAATGISDLRKTYRLALFTLTGIAGMVLLVACANVANLLLARGAAREREIAVRMALGAARSRVVCQLLMETVLLATIGAAMGVVFSLWTSRLLVSLISTTTRVVSLDLAIDGRVVVFAVSAAVVTALLFGIVPTWRATSVDRQVALRRSGRGVVGRDPGRLGRSLVVAQLAFSLTLLTASGLLLSSFRKLVTLDPGFERRGVVIASMRFPKNMLPGQYLAMQRDVLSRLRALPGAVDASASYLTPIGDNGWGDLVGAPGYSPALRKDSLVFANAVSESYFATLGMAMIAGRDIGPTDIVRAARIAVVNETMARQFFSGRAIGKTFRTTTANGLSEPREIIGVVRDARYASLTETSPPSVYYPMGQGDVAHDEMQFEIRWHTTPAVPARTILDVSRAVNPSITTKLTTLIDQVSASIARPHLLAILSGFFGALALLLATMGLYGTISYDVARRRNEIGIRIALGAAGSDVARLIVGEAGVVLLLGVAVGAGLAGATTRLLSSLLFDLSPTDPRVFVASALILATTAIVAALIPALRGARQDPMTVLRQE